MIPARRSAWRNPTCSAMAPPREKPAGAIPRCRSRSTSASIWRADWRTPASSSRRAPARARMSYHARMTWPWLMVTGRRGAWGKTNRTGRRAGSRSAGTLGSNPWTAGPGPCIQITAAVGLGALSISTASRRSGMAGVVVVGSIRRIGGSGAIDTRSAHPYRRGREPRERATPGGPDRGAARLARWDEGNRDPLDRVLPLLHRVQRRPAAVAARSRLPRFVREDLRPGVSRRAGPLRRVGGAHRGGPARVQRGRGLPRALGFRALLCARPAGAPADGLGRVVPKPPGS